MVDVAMLDCQLAILENALTTYLVTGVVPGPLGTRHPNIAPFQAFRTQDRPIVICAGHDVQFHALCAAIGRSDLIGDARFDTADHRRANVDALERELETALAARSAADWLEILAHAEVPVAPIHTVADAVRHPQTAARKMVTAVPDPAIGTLYVAGNPIKMSEVPERETRRPPPEIDADRTAILAWLRGG
jgi:CoA:oxalate CoA-transferase